MKLQTKRIVSFHKAIGDMIAAEYDRAMVTQLELACQSAANDVDGKAKDPKITPVKLQKQKTEVSWKEQTTVEFNGKVCTPTQFLAWHDSLEVCFKEHGAPYGELSYGLMPELLQFWLDTLRKRKQDKDAKDKSDAKDALAATRKQVADANGPTATGNRAKGVKTPEPAK